MGLLDVLGALKSKEVAALVDKAGRYLIYCCIVLGTSFIVGLSIATDAVSFEVGVGAITGIATALAAIEKTIFKTKEEGK